MQLTVKSVSDSCDLIDLDLLGRKHERQAIYHRDSGAETT